MSGICIQVHENVDGALNVPAQNGGGGGGFMAGNPDSPSASADKGSKKVLNLYVPEWIQASPSPEELTRTLMRSPVFSIPNTTHRR